MKAPKWFRIAISEGLTRLIALSLPNTPPHETIALTKEAWIESLYENRNWIETDSPRIAAAFRSLSRRVDRWPAPRALLDNLPSRPEQKKLPSPPPTAEQRKRAAEILRRARKMVRK